MNNQNNLNVSDERLAELKKEKEANQAILNQIQEERATLRQEKGKFETFKQEALSQIAEERKTILKESEALDRQRKALGVQPAAAQQAAPVVEAPKEPAAAQQSED
jgi:lysozyme family protein